MERINGNTRIENKIIYSIKKLVEGDAKLIENICKEKYYPNPQRNIHKWAKYFNNSVAERSYVEGKNILLENFGGDRGKINELYNKNIDELVEIFVQK